MEKVGPLTRTFSDTPASLLGRCVVAAARFRDLATAPGARSSRTWAAEMCSALGELYSALVSAELALQAANHKALLWSEPSVSDSNRWNPVQEVDEQIGTNLGTANLYWEYFDPRDATSALSTTVSNDIAEILGDVGPIADLAASMPAITDEVALAPLCECVEAFAIHWGAHLVDVLRVLHRLARTDEE